jgi:hypothetical protein
MKQRKQFDLADYKPGDKVETRCGRAARIICTNEKGNTPVVALVSYTEYEYELAVEYKSNGHGSNGDNALDLFIITDTPDKSRLS